MSLKQRLRRLEEERDDLRTFPLLCIDTDGRCYVGSEETTEAAWYKEYSPEIERAKAAGRFVGIDFSGKEPPACASANDVEGTEL